MGQIVKQMGGDTTRYYWYPGDKKEYLRSAAAIVLGILAYLVLHAVTHASLMPAVAGTSIAAMLAGFNFGRRDSRAIAAFAEATSAGRDKNAARSRRRTAVVHSGRAVWRGFAEGAGGAAAAILIANLPADGVVANWLLPWCRPRLALWHISWGWSSRASVTAGPPVSRQRLPAIRQRPRTRRNPTTRRRPSGPSGRRASSRAADLLSRPII